MFGLERGEAKRIIANARTHLGHLNVLLSEMESRGLVKQIMPRRKKPISEWRKELIDLQLDLGKLEGIMTKVEKLV